MRKSVSIVFVVLAATFAAGLSPVATGTDPDTDPYQRSFYGLFKNVQVLDPVSANCPKSKGIVEFEGFRWPPFAHIYRVHIAMHPGEDARTNPMDRCKAFVPFADSCLMRGLPHTELDGFCETGGNLTLQVWPRDNMSYFYRNFLGGRYTAEPWTSFVLCANTNTQPFLSVGYCGSEDGQGDGSGPGQNH